MEINFNEVVERIRGLEVKINELKKFEGGLWDMERKLMNRKPELEKQATELLFNHFVQKDRNAFFDLEEVRAELDLIRIYKERREDLKQYVQKQISALQREFDTNVSMFEARYHGRDWRDGIPAKSLNQQYADLKARLGVSSPTEFSKIANELRTFIKNYGNDLKPHQFPYHIEALIDEKRKQLGVN